MTATKNIVVLVEGTPNPERPVTLLPGATVGEALHQAGLDPSKVFLRTRDGLGQLAAGENLFHIADPGDEFSASPLMDAGQV